VADGGEGGWDYFFLPEAWKTEVCRGFDARMIAEAMILRGLLLPNRDGKHLAKTIKTPGYKKMRLYHVPAAILDGGDHA
jgi:putative DNA primase/helicase